MIWPLVVIALGQFALHAWTQLKHMHERKHWDIERRSYVAAALASQSSPAAGSAVIRPKADRPDPPANRPVQLDL